MNLLNKIKYSFAFLLISFLLLTLNSCRKETLQVNDPTSYTSVSYSQIFEAFWTGMNNNYIFWDIDPTNWDDVYVKYKPLFAKLKVNVSDDDVKAFNYFTEMTENLVDSHYNFSAPLWNGNVGINPSALRHSKSADHHEPIDVNFFLNLIPNKYLNADYNLSYEQIPVFGSLNDFHSVSGKIKNTNILYFRFSNFGLSNINNIPKSNSYKVLQFYLNEIKNNSNLTGLIIDLRANGGGELRDLNLLVGSLTNAPYVFGTTHAKSGMNRLDYTPWIEAKVYPFNNNTKAFTKPIVVLADLNSISMAEMSTMALKSLPFNKVTFVGERTWGGLGQIDKNINDFNSGSFSTKFLGEVYCSTTALRYKDGKCYEGIGFPPDIEVKYNQASIDAGIDLQLEKAISVLAK